MQAILAEFGTWLTKQLASAVWRASMGGLYVSGLAWLINEYYPRFEAMLIGTFLPWLLEQFQTVFPDVFSGVDLETLGVYVGYANSWVPVRFSFQCFSVWLVFGMTWWGLRRVMNLYPGMGGK